MYIYTSEQWLLFFYIYCFIGWIWESLYVSARTHKWTNRGFMHGPLLPIYGSGAIIVLFTTLPFKDNIPLTFLFGMISATILEYFTGVAMEALFKIRYWDYSDQPFNLNGHICLFCSLGWGLFSVILTEYAHAPIEKFVLNLPAEPLKIGVFLITIIATIDMTESFRAAFDLKSLITEIADNNEELKHLQNRVDVIITNLDEKKDIIKDKIAEKTEERDERYQRIEEKIHLSLNKLTERENESKGKYNQYINEIKSIKENISAKRINEEHYYKKDSIKKLLERNPKLTLKNKSADILSEIKMKFMNKK